MLSRALLGLLTQKGQRALQRVEKVGLPILFKRHSTGPIIPA